MHSNAMVSKTKKVKKDKWALNVTSGQKREAKVDLPSPPGYNPQVTNIVKAGRKTDDEGNHTNLVNKKAWDIALAPIKGLPMNVFIMYMSGNTISIFPIMMVGMMFFRPIQALMAIRATMKMLERSTQYILQTLVYMLGNFMAIGLAVYKCNSMGLLPTHASDWLSFASPLQRMEYVAGGITL